MTDCCIFFNMIIMIQCTACDEGETNTRGDVPWGASTECEAPITKCAVGQHVDLGSCRFCSAGTSRTQEDVISGGDTFCTVEYCEINHYVQHNQCVPCPAGTMRDSGDGADGIDTTCSATKCQDNEHTVGHQCVACPAGTTMTDADTSMLDAESICEAKICSKGEHVESHQCKACASGYDNDAGDDASGVDTNCGKIVCPLNTHVSDSSTSAICKPCAEGTFNDIVSELSSGDTTCKNNDEFCSMNQKRVSGACVACGSGREMKERVPKIGAEDTTCNAVTCAKDEHVVDNKCLACQPGTEADAGADASGDDTQCSTVTCSKDEHVVDNKCRQCSAGKFRDAGDLAISTNTMCAAKTCGENEFVQNNRCNSCPAGSVRAAGDSTASPTTECAPTMCELSEYVENHVCKKCPDGEANSIQTDASGDNNQPKCVAPKATSIEAAFEIQHLTVEAAKKAIDTIKKIIHKTYLIAVPDLQLRDVNIESIESGKRRRLLSATTTTFISRHLAGADVVVRYTVTHATFSDATVAAKATESFNAKVESGDFVTSLRSEDQSTFGDAKVYTEGTAAEKEEAEKKSTTAAAPSPTVVAKGDKISVSVPIEMMVGIAGAVILLFVIVGVVMKKKNNQGKELKVNGGNTTKVTPMDARTKDEERDLFEAKKQKVINWE